MREFPDPEVDCFEVCEDGSHSVVKMRHGFVSTHLGGKVTFVGSVHGHLAVALLHSEERDANVACADAKCFDCVDSSVRGKVVLVREDDDTGLPVNVDAECLTTYFSSV